MKLVKIHYSIDNDIDGNCLNDCPFQDEMKSHPMCGSVVCRECKNCLGSGQEPIINLKYKTANYEQGYIYCKQAHRKYTLRMRLMRFIHIVKMKFNRSYQ